MDVCFVCPGHNERAHRAVLQAQFLKDANVEFSPALPASTNLQLHLLLRTPFLHHSALSARQDPTLLHCLPGTPTLHCSVCQVPPTLHCCLSGIYPPPPCTVCQVGPYPTALRCRVSRLRLSAFEAGAECPPHLDISSDDAVRTLTVIRHVLWCPGNLINQLSPKRCSHRTKTRHAVEQQTLQRKEMFGI